LGRGRENIEVKHTKSLPLLEKGPGAGGDQPSHTRKQPGLEGGLIKDGKSYLP